MQLIDLHVDTLTELWMGKLESLASNKGHVDIKKMQASNTLVICLALFYPNKGSVSNELNQDGSYHFSVLTDFYDFSINEINKYSNEIARIESFSDIARHREEGKISIMLTVEDSGALNNRLERIDQLYKMGIRMISPTWDNENCLGFPNSDDRTITEKGLKPFGFEAIERMNDLGIIIDITHLSDGGIFDVLRHSKAPIVASHTNAKAICDDRRNITDEMIRGISEKGGLSGVKLFPPSITKDSDARLEQIMHHIRHIIKAGGIEGIALGTDFDGYGNTDDAKIDINDISEFYKLHNRMKKEGFSEEEIEKLFYKNALRLFESVLK